MDADFQISAAALNVGALKLAPAKIEGSLSSGIVKMTLSELGLYEGKAAAGLALDASIPSPIFAMRAELRGVRALPLLTSAADFTSLDGRMSAQIDVRSTGRNQREMIANLSGTTNVDFQDGEIRGINVAQMIRNLTSSTLSGWQESGALKTDLAELHASFRIEKGKAETSDLRLAGPLVRVTGTGSTDLNTKTLSFRIEPKLVMTTQGQGSTAADPIGLGVPVVMEGPWSAPRMYPDMAGILDNPDAAFGKLRELGQGLFGPNFLGGSGSGGRSAGAAGPGQQGDREHRLDHSGFRRRLRQQSGDPGNHRAAGGPAGSGAAGRSAWSGTAGRRRGSSPSQDPQNQIDNVIRQLFGR